jgi:hypothetical protein
MKIRHLPLLLLVTAPLAAATHPISPDALLKHIRFLSSDDLAGRGNGTKGLETAADYIADQFKAAGLRPGGTNGGWFQPLEIVTGLTLGDVNRLSIRSGNRSVSFELGVTYYPLSATSNDSTRVASAEVSRAPLVFAGYGISAPALNYDDYEGVDVRDKAVIVFTHEPQENDEKSPFDGKSFTQHTTLMNKAMTARNKGARVLIAVSDPTHSTDNGAYQGFKRDPQADDYGIPVLRVQRSRIAPLLEAWQLDAVAREIDRDLKPRSRPLEGATADYVEHLAKTRRTVRNVVGILPGADPARASEAIVIGAHYDHLGLGGRHSLSPDLAGQIHNGADDNASGTAAIIEIARAAAADRARFPRTTVFVTFAGEELGLLGSTYYVNNPAVPLDRTVAMLNLDMVGRPRGRIMVTGLDAAPTLHDELNAAATAVPALEVRRFQEGAGVGASDDTSFALKRIPSIGFFSGFHSDYHRPTDDWQLIEPAGAAGVATLAFELASRISVGSERPEYVAPVPAAHGPGGDPGAVGGYGPYFGSVPDFGEQESGVKFAEVRETSPAGRAGLRGGDVMVSFDGKPVKTLFDFTFLLRQKKPGDEVEVTVMRNGQPLTVKVLLTTRP